MRNVAAGALIVWGSLTMLYGAWLLGYQMKVLPPPPSHTVSYKFSLTSASGKTAYPGLIVMMLGAILLAAGALLAN